MIKSIYSFVTDQINKVRQIPLIGWLLEQIAGNYAVILTLGILGFVGASVNSFLSHVPSFSVVVQYYLAQHPVRAVIAIAVFLGAIVYIATTVALFSRMRKYAKDYFKQKEILTHIGFRAFFPCNTSGSKENTWNFFVKDIESKSPQHIEILAVTGKYTFGDKKAPLSSFLEQFDGEIRILLIDPFCPALRQRAAAVNSKVEHYKKDIFDSINFCRMLYEKGKHITVKIYEQKPIWKMIYTDSFLWLQYYHPGTHIEHSPVYTFFPNQEKTSIYYPLADVFQKRWHHDNNKVINLSVKQTYRDYLKNQLPSHNS
jgi:hypothetical protein